MTDDKKGEKKGSEVRRREERRGEERWGREAEDGGRGQEEEEASRLFVKAASRTTMRRENRAPGRGMSDVSDETPSKSVHSDGDDDG